MIGIVNVIAIGFILLMILVLYCCMAISGKRNTNESGIHRFDNVTIGECETSYKEKGFKTTIENGHITGFELEY